MITAEKDAKSVGDAHDIDLGIFSAFSIEEQRIARA